MTPARIASAADEAALSGRSVRIETVSPVEMVLLARRSGDCVVGMVGTRDLDFDARQNWTVVSSNGPEAPETLLGVSPPWPLAAIHSHPLLRPDQMVLHATRQADTGPQVFQISTPAEAIATE